MSGNANETRQAYIVRMQLEGKEVCIPERHQLFLDLDSMSQVEAFLKSFPIFVREMEEFHVLNSVNIFTITFNKSSSGAPYHWHVRITMCQPSNIFSPVERIAWQAALGSDPCRELLSMIRHQNGDDDCTLLVESPGWQDKTFTYFEFVKENMIPQQVQE